ncbi:lanthionine synthetase C family protein [Streptomyces sp. ISL-22]|uniref:lanthionine synthetase C family protein n=1 Tax=unclassified Streptomyces TaxID=2593676 RepID=UPI001BE51842|nr:MULTISPECIES: lanthionine synthetase C family protein [unclassified Streptomyces]MBT2420750.1 lanthionine synthetase C family protein [Streptomyces sp. ISL-24]MBT2437620.1 lanthionine synthetase C family protein [Streptomyces sp. ISL-22]
MTAQAALDLADAVAEQLADPHSALLGPAARRQHLAHGLPGIALLHIERAAVGLGPWQCAHDWLAATSREPLTSGPDSHPFYGAPAFAHALTCAADHLPGAYQRALATLDRQMTADVHRRLDAAHHRMDAGRLPALAEFDTIRGLTGYGTHLLRRSPSAPALRAVLDYCVRLTQPITYDGETLPGWWTDTGPSGRPDDRFPGGHANSGMAHGIGGVLALLALAARHGTFVDGHDEALGRILAWLDHWQEDTGRGPTCPYWITRDELRTGLLAPSSPRRPSWCYGTAGLARAQQLAALALGDIGRQVDAETALVAALTDPAQLKATTDNGLCHGFAGLAHVAARAADDAHPSTVGQLRGAIPALLAAVHPPGTDPVLAATTLIQDEERGPGLLNGAAGIALALLPPSTTAPPRSAWDACLLIA